MEWHTLFLFMFGCITRDTSQKNALCLVLSHVINRFITCDKTKRD